MTYPKREDGKEWVEVTVSNNVLELKQKKGFVGGDEIITVRLANLKGLEVSGSCKVTVDASDNLKSYFDLQFDGASKVVLNNISTEKLSVDGSGGTEATISGQTDLLFLELSGASGFDGNSLKAENVNVDMSGASTADVTVSGEVTGDLNGASKLKYRGNPSLKVDRSAGASLNQLN